MDPLVAQRMERHLCQLADDHGIRVYWINDRWKAESFPEDRSVFVPRVQAPVDYWFGLHELGHILSPTSLALMWSVDPTSMLVCEAAAWAWASEHARYRRHLRRADHQEIGNAFATYVTVDYRPGRLPKSLRPGA